MIGVPDPNAEKRNEIIKNLKLDLEKQSDSYENITDCEKTLMDYVDSINWLDSKSEIYYRAERIAASTENNVLSENSRSLLKIYQEHLDFKTAIPFRKFGKIL